MSYRSCLAALLAAAFFAVSLTGARAQTANSHSIFRNWLTATNNGDANGAAQFLGSDFSLTLADGSQVSGAAAGEQAIMALGTPITVVSLTATSSHELDAQLQFNGGATMSVVIKGESQTIQSIAISAGSTSGPAASPAVSQSTSPTPTATAAGS